MNEELLLELRLKMRAEDPDDMSLPTSLYEQLGYVNPWEIVTYKCAIAKRYVQIVDAQRKREEYMMLTGDQLDLKRETDAARKRAAYQTMTSEQLDVKRKRDAERKRKEYSNMTPDQKIKYKETNTENRRAARELLTQEERDLINAKERARKAAKRQDPAYIAAERARKSTSEYKAKRNARLKANRAAKKSAV